MLAAALGHAGGLGFRVWGLGFRSLLRFSDMDLGIRVSFRGQALGFRDEVLGIRVSVLGFRPLGLGSRLTCAKER